MRYHSAVLRPRRRLTDAWRSRASAASEGLGPVRLYTVPVGAAPDPGGSAVVDLLHATPRPWGDLRGAHELVRFGFEGGDCEGLFDALLAAHPLAPSTFVPSSFASQLFLDELVRRCFVLRVSGARVEPNVKEFRRIVEAPPTDPVHCAARQEVLRELTERPVFRADLERLYAGVRELRAALEMAPSSEPSVVRRKIAVLVAIQRCGRAMADGFEGSASLLARLREHGQGLCRTDGWKRLVELVDLEGHLATVDVRMRLGSDGTVREFSMLAVREPPRTALAPGPFRRVLDRWMSFLRGYRFGETEVVVRLLEEVFTPMTAEVVGWLALTGPLEFYLASLGFRDLAQAAGLEVCLPTFVEDSERSFEAVFNPLLFVQDVTPRGCDLRFGPGDGLVLVTGPNSGGKTRLLQALGLSQLLGQAGLFVPARTARLRWAPGLFLSLVVDDGAAQAEGRLGTELLRIRALFEQLEPGSLAILDELCSGTNPDEGEALFEMVVSLLPQLEPQVFVSTHFLGLAARLEREARVPGLAFMQVELDGAERPTYRFVSGVASSSLAHKVAARLGVTRETLGALVEEKRARRRASSKNPS